MECKSASLRIAAYVWRIRTRAVQPGLAQSIMCSTRQGMETNPRATTKLPRNRRTRVEESRVRIPNSHCCVSIRSPLEKRAPRSLPTPARSHPRRTVHRELVLLGASLQEPLRRAVNTTGLYLPFAVKPQGKRHRLPHMQQGKRI